MKSHLSTKTKVEFNGSCLRQDKITYVNGIVVNIYIVYEINKNYDISSYPILRNCLFAAVTLTKNADIDTYKYSGYGIGFDRKWFFSHPSGRTDKNIIFGRDMSSSAKIDNRKKQILILGKGSYTGIRKYTGCRKNVLN